MDLSRFEIGWDGCVFGEMDGKEKKKKKKKMWALHKSALYIGNFAPRFCFFKFQLSKS